MAAVRSHLSVTRVPRTNILNISYTSGDPIFSARVANAVAEAYIVDQHQSHKDTAIRASLWLNSQVGELHSIVQASEQSIQKLRSEPNLVAPEGRLLAEQRMTEANKLLMAARAETVRLETRHSKLRSIIDGKLNELILSEFSTDPIISQLRQKYIATTSTESAALKKLGPGHDAVIRLQAQANDYARVLRQELLRIAKTVQSELEIAQAQEARQQRDLEVLLKSSNENSFAQLELRELERKGEAYKSIYKDFIQRHQSARQQQNFDDRNARVISRAQIPNRDNSPLPLQTMLLSLLLGAGVGGVLGLAREYSDRTFRTRQQVRDELGVASVWMLPILLPQQASIWRRQQVATDEDGVDQGPIKTTRQASGVLTQVLDRRGSAYTREIGMIRIGIDQKLRDKATRVVGIVSAFPKEGRSTLAKNLASLCAASSAKTLLIDCDPINRQLTGLLAPSASLGMRDAALSAEANLDDMLFREAKSGLFFLPSAGSDATDYTPDWMAATEIHQLLRRLSSEFKYVILDLPEISERVEAHAVAPCLDGVVQVVEWGSSSRSHVSKMFSEEPEIFDRCLGVAMTSVAPDKVKLYEGSYLKRMQD